MYEIPTVAYVGVELAVFPAVAAEAKVATVAKAAASTAAINKAVQVAAHAATNAAVRALVGA